MKNKRPRLGSAVIVEKDCKILLGKRNKKNAFGKWVIPGGGVRYGETIKEAAVREIKEETNLDIELVKAIGFKEIINLPGDYHTIVFFHLAKPKNMNIKANEDISEIGFFTIDEIKKLDTVESVEWVLRKAGLWR
ncbi:NUDIX domain-containing protein [Candidatus Woesearchaeota archaeon]|nr:NUDIX domain-containing protein [Candidatus Woesearchaeota archaeon]